MDKHQEIKEGMERAIGNGKPVEAEAVVIYRDFTSYDNKAQPVQQQPVPDNGKGDA